jgi:hypothetical protein
MKMRNWAAVIRSATMAAEKQGHVLGPFSKPSMRTPDVRVASCEKCGGCCDVGYIKLRSGDRYSASGRLLKYRCGTPEAAGFLPTKDPIREPEGYEQSKSN